MVEMEAIDFNLRLYDPRVLKMKVITNVKIVDVDGNIVSLEPESEREIEDMDDVIFDKEFSNTLLITFADLVHGEFEGVVKLYQIPENAQYIFKIYSVESNGKNVELIKICEMKKNSIVIKYYERLPELKEKDERIQEICSVAKLREEIVYKVVKN